MCNVRGNRKPVATCMYRKFVYLLRMIKRVNINILVRNPDKSDFYLRLYVCVYLVNTTRILKFKTVMYKFVKSDQKYKFPVKAIFLRQ